MARQEKWQPVVRTACCQVEGTQRRTIQRPHPVQRPGGFRAPVGCREQVGFPEPADFPALVDCPEPLEIQVTLEIPAEVTEEEKLWSWGGLHPHYV